LLKSMSSLIVHVHAVYYSCRKAPLSSLLKSTSSSIVHVHAVYYSCRKAPLSSLLKRYVKFDSSRPRCVL
ncbi:hypothetical protein J6590_081707, partial [Homalodisca vitripennis]